MMCQAGNDYCTRGTSVTDQAQTLRLFVEYAKREWDQLRPDQMPDRRQASQKYGAEVETEVPMEVSRYVPGEVRSEMYRLVDMVCSAVEALRETDPKLWPNSSSYCPDMLDKMLNTVMDQEGVSDGLTKPLMMHLMQDVMQITEHDRTQLEINGGPVKEVMTNLLQISHLARCRYAIEGTQRTRWAGSLAHSP